MFEKALKLLTVSAFIVFPISTIAQEDSVSSEIEEITVTGSQIKGAKITGALPVSVLDFQDVDGQNVVMAVTVTCEHVLLLVCEEVRCSMSCDLPC